jgi:hypothetical protein
LFQHAEEIKNMKDLLEVLSRLWLLVANSPRWVQGLAAIVLFASVAEFAQDGFLGSPMFWVAAPLLPWPQLVEPYRTLATTYTIRRPEDTGFAPLGFGAPCPVGSQVDVAVERGGDGWMAVAGWNQREGFYPVARSGLGAIPIEKDKTYSFRLNMKSSAGREYLVAIASSKRFDGEQSFQKVLAQLQAAAADSKGGAPELQGTNLGWMEVGGLGSCQS